MSDLPSKCKNCGAGLVVINNGVSKCEYCGTIYGSSEQPVHSEPSIKIESSKSINNEGQEDPNKGLKSAFGIIFLFACVLLVIMALIHKRTGFATGLLVSDSPPDSSKVDSLMAIGSNGVFYKKVVNKPNPDPLLPIKGKIHTTKDWTTIKISITNKTGEDDYFDTHFTFKVYDKSGKELKTGDSNEREYYFHVLNGETATEEWSLKNRLPTAKSIKVQIKDIERDSVLWNYKPQ